MAKSVDVKSYELAEHFLDDEPFNNEANRQTLAEAIQMTVEDTIASLREESNAAAS